MIEFRDAYNPVEIGAELMSTRISGRALDAGANPFEHWNGRKSLWQC